MKFSVDALSEMQLIDEHFTFLKNEGVRVRSASVYLTSGLTAHVSHNDDTEEFEFEVGP